MIEPCGHRVLLEVKDITELDPVYASAKKAGLELAQNHEDHLRKQAGLDKGVVVSLGSTAFKDFGGTAWCKPGDLVVFAKYSGKIIEDLDKKKYVILNDEDIIAVLKD
jgi:co-chaperonin GroES (HSP10)